MCSGSTEPPLRQTFSFSSTRDDQFIQAASHFCASKNSTINSWLPPYFSCCSMYGYVCKESRWNWRREKQTMGHFQWYLAQNYFRHIQSYISPYMPVWEKSFVALASNRQSGDDDAGGWCSALADNIAQTERASSYSFSRLGDDDDDVADRKTSLKIADHSAHLPTGHTFELWFWWV